MSNPPENRFSEIKRILLIILALNWTVALAKIIYGLFSHFSSMTADGFHSLADGASNIVGIVGITLAAQPPDKDHPYGHKKYETLASLGIASLLVFTSYNLLISGIKNIHNGEVPHIDALSFAVMILTMGVNIFVMRYEYIAGRRLNSDVLISDSQHTSADLLTSASVIAALVASKMGFLFVNHMVTILIAIFIAYIALSIFRQGSSVLCDTVALSDTHKIENIVLEIPGVQSCHKIRTRGREDDIHIDLHVQVKPSMHINTAHKISHEIVDALKKGIPGVTDVVVHMEPLENHPISHSSPAA